MVRMLLVRPECFPWGSDHGIEAIARELALPCAAYLKRAQSCRTHAPMMRPALGSSARPP